MIREIALVIPQPEDYDELVAVWEASVRATHHFLSEADIQYFKPLIRNQYLSALSLYCIKSELGQIEGFMGIAETKIEMLFILPNARKKGLGKSMVQFAVRHLGINKVEVNEQNHQAVGFYEHLGFKVIGRLPVDGSGKPYPILKMALAENKTQA